MKALITAFLLLAGTGLFAQEITIGHSEEFTNVTPKATWHSFLGHDETGFYILKKEGPISSEKIWLEKYSPDFKLLYTYNIEATSGVMGNSMLHRYTKMNKGKVIVFLEGWNKAESQNSLWLKEVGTDGKLPEEGTLLEKEFSTGQMKSADYSVSFSPDGSKLVVMTEKPYAKGQREELRLQVFSTDGYTSLWTKEITFENEAERYPSNDVLVTNDGLVYLYKDYKISNKEHTYQLFTYGKDLEKSAAIYLMGYFPSAYKMQLDETGNLILAGTLANAGENASNWRGVWYLRADATGQILQNKTEQLGADLLRLVVSEKNAMQDNFALDNYLLKDVLLKPGGGIILLTEYQRKNYSVVGTTQPPVYNHELEYGNVAVVSLDTEGKRLWSNVIVKKQQENTLNADHHYGSVAYQLKNNNLYVVWNYTDIHVDMPLGKFRYWFDRSGAKINIDNIFGKEAFYPTVLTVLQPDGTFGHPNHSFNSLPLTEIQKPNAFSMAIDPSFFFSTSNGIVVLSRMPGGEAKRFKFNTIRF